MRTRPIRTYCSESPNIISRKTGSGARWTRLPVFVFVLLLVTAATMMVPTMAWTVTDRYVSAHSGPLTARHTDFTARITILPCTDTPNANDRAQAADAMYRNSRYTGLSAGDEYEICVTVLNRAERAKSFDIMLDALTLIGANGESLPADVFLLGLPTADGGAVSYFAETQPILTENGHRYVPCTVPDDAPAASVLSLAAGEEISVTFRIRLREDAEALDITAEMLSGAVFRIGQISIRDTTPKT